MPSSRSSAGTACARCCGTLLRTRSNSVPMEGVRRLRPVVLFGPMGSGKTTIAPLVASELGRPWIDIDAEVEARAGRSIQEIFENEGESRFRELERKALLEAL